MQGEPRKKESQWHSERQAPVGRRRVPKEQDSRQGVQVLQVAAKGEDAHWSTDRQISSTSSLLIESRAQEVSKSSGEFAMEKHAAPAAAWGLYLSARCPSRSRPGLSCSQTVAGVLPSELAKPSGKPTVCQLVTGSASSCRHRNRAAGAIKAFHYDINLIYDYCHHLLNGSAHSRKI